MPPTRTEQTRAALIATAERMIAERGTAVSLREISKEAGQRNHSAAQYHFGSRQGLIEAVIADRSVAVDEYRSALLAEVAPDAPGTTTADLLRVLIEPWVAVLRGGLHGSTGSGRYLGFLAQCLDDPDLEESLVDWTAGPVAVREVNRALVARAGAGADGDAGADGEAGAALARRMAWVHAVALRVLAHEQRLGTRSPQALDAVRDDLVRMLGALLEG